MSNGTFILLILGFFIVLMQIFSLKTFVSFWIEILGKKRKNAIRILSVLSALCPIFVFILVFVGSALFLFDRLCEGLASLKMVSNDDPYDDPYDCL